MFERIDIRMDAPVCDCCNGNYNAAKMSWGIWLDNGEAALSISCAICKTQLKIPNKKFVARFVFGNPPPDGDKDPIEDEDEKPVDVVGNVIQLKVS